jgi:hypothetical protein
MRHLIDKLRDLWHFLRREQGLTTTFSKFMKALAARGDVTSLGWRSPDVVSVVGRPTTVQSRAAGFPHAVMGRRADVKYKHGSRIEASARDPKQYRMWDLVFENRGKSHQARPAGPAEALNWRSRPQVQKRQGDLFGPELLDGLPARPAWQHPKGRQESEHVSRRIPLYESVDEYVRKELGWSEAVIRELTTLEEGMPELQEWMAKVDNLQAWDRVKQTKAGQYLTTGGEKSLGIMQDIWRIGGQPVYQFYKEMGLSIAKSVHVEPQKDLVGEGPIDTRVRMIVAGWDKKMEQLAKATGLKMIGGKAWLPNALTRPFWKWEIPSEITELAADLRLLDANSATYTRDRDRLMAAASPEAQRFVTEVQKMYEEQRLYAQERAGLWMPQAPNYTMPLQFNPGKIAEHRDGMIDILADEVIQRARDWQKTHPNAPIPTRAQAEKDAEQWVAALESEDFSFDPGGMLGISSQYGPGVKYNERKISLDGWRRLRALGVMETDVMTLFGVYSRKLARRVEWQRDGGYKSNLFYLPKEEERELRRTGKTDADIRKIQNDRRTARFKKQDDLMRLNIDPSMIWQPTVKWVEEAMLKVRAGEMTNREYDHFMNKALPASLGTLGLALPQHYKRTAQILQLYQSVRLLPMSLFASFMDAGIVAWRHRDFKAVTGTIIETLRESKATRGQKIDLLESLGIMNNAATAHTFNAAYMDGQYMAVGVNKWTEAFFRLNFMHQWTESTRYIAAQLAQKFMIKHAARARAGDAESVALLRHVGVNYDQVLNAMISPSELNMSSADIARAVAVYVDQSVMRPTTATRPWWGSHPIGGIFFFLKGFMYQFQAVVLQSIWNEANRKGSTLSHKVMVGLAASAALVALTLPLTMLGYELRRQIGTKDAEWMDQWDEKGPMGYMMELIRRSGYMGLVEVPVAMEGDASRGGFWLNPVLGPSVEQFVDGALSGGALTAKWWAGSVPILGGIPRGRDALREAFSWED